MRLYIFEITVILIIYQHELVAQDAYHATFTSYENSKLLWYEHRTQFHVNDCEPIQFILYSRHASRYPGRKAIKRMHLHLPKIKDLILRDSRINGSIKELFRHWHLQYNESHHHLLSKTGEDEMYHIGKRYGKRFIELLGPPFMVNYQEYRHTMKHRTKLSAKMFAAGALGVEGMHNFTTLPPKNPDLLLRFYKTCEKWRKDIDKSVVAHVEEKKYLNSSSYLAVMKRVSDLLFLTEDMVIKHDEIKAIYTACTFDYIINQNRSSPWCSLLTYEDRRALEYWEDVEHFWTDGYAFPLTYEQACRPVSDLVQNFRDAISGKKYKKAVLRFSHLGLLLKIFARFGLFNDGVNLTSGMFNKEELTSNFSVHNRQYRMSKIGPMASNIAFALYKCQKRYKLKTFVQEHEVQLKGCKSSLCDLKRFLSIYQKMADNCNVDQLCRR